ncbi:hypothetical protein BGZ93_005919 [Podila epicladia]|nr:hypothetical protein BGZ92_010666 [Podila epicladia]KAG0095420.1 hypothetical protein BGZ93_005919 [Podila epicladia]
MFSTNITTWISILRWLVAALCLVNFGLDMFQIKAYNTYLTIVLHWRFLVQAVASTCLMLWLLLAELDSINLRRKALTADHKIHAHGSSWPRWLLWYTVRWTMIFGICVALLQATLQASVTSKRTAFTLPYNRNTPEADALYWSWTHDDIDISEDDEYVQIVHVYNPRDLHDCSKYDYTLGQPLTMLCSFDQATVVIGIVVGFLAMMESVLTVWSSLKALFRARRSFNKAGKYMDAEGAAQGRLHELHSYYVAPVTIRSVATASHGLGFGDTLSPSYSAYNTDTPSKTGSLLNKKAPAPQTGADDVKK